MKNKKTSLHEKYHQQTKLSFSKIQDIFPEEKKKPLSQGKTRRLKKENVQKAFTC